MKPALVPVAAVLLAVPHAAQAAEPLCERLAALVAAQWADPSDPVPRHWVEFHWGVEGETANRSSWACRYSGDETSGEFCDWLMSNASQGFHVALPFDLLKCMDAQSAEPAAGPSLFLEGQVRRRAQDGSWLVLEVASATTRVGEGAMRISFDSDDRRLAPERLPAMQAFQPEPEAPGTLK